MPPSQLGCGSSDVDDGIESYHVDWLIIVRKHANKDLTLG